MQQTDTPELDLLDIRGLLAIYGVLWLCDFAILFNGHAGGFALFSTMLMALWIGSWRHSPSPRGRSGSHVPEKGDDFSLEAVPLITPARAEALTNARGLAKGLSAILAMMLVLALLM